MTRNIENVFDDTKREVDIIKKELMKLDSELTIDFFNPLDVLGKNKTKEKRHLLWVLKSNFTNATNNNLKQIHGIDVDWILPIIHLINLGHSFLEQYQNALNNYESMKNSYLVLYISIIALTVAIISLFSSSLTQLIGRLV